MRQEDLPRPLVDRVRHLASLGWPVTAIAVQTGLSAETVAEITGQPVPAHWEFARC